MKPTLLALLAGLARGATPRYALFWLGPYSNITTVDGYLQAWHQWSDNRRPGYIAAGSAFAVKPNGTVGFANTAAGEGTYGDIMAHYGFPALKKMNITTLGMTYVTHYAAITNITADPQSFVNQMVALADQYQLDGFDLDYEPQQDTFPVGEKVNMAALTASFMAVVGQLTAALTQSGRIVTIDVSGCPTANSFQCKGAATAGLAHVNTMDTFGVSGVSDLKNIEGIDSKPLGALWFPGFEPAGLGNQTWHAVTQYMASKPSVYKGLATWGASTSSVPGIQPQWFFDAVNAFLDAP